MRRQRPMTAQDIIDYNLRDGGTAYTVFADAQPDRIERARGMLSTILAEIGRRAVIWEPGCSAGDISGYFSADHDVYGIDIVPAAVEAAKSRYPAMRVAVAQAEQVEAPDMDVLVLCEFLEHIHDPITFVEEWLPKTKYVLIGHPLVDNGDGHDAEWGHPWAYETQDFMRWFELGGHRLREHEFFPMYDYEMVMGWGQKILEKGT